MKKVSIGDWTKLEHVFVLLHEHGHTHQDIAGLKKLFKEINRKLSVIDQLRPLSDKSRMEQKELLKERAGLISKKERDAWAFGLRDARQIRARTGINLVNESFHDNKELEEFINAALSSYRKVQQKRQWDDDGEFLKQLFDKERA